MKAVLAVVLCLTVHAREVRLSWNPNPAGENVQLYNLYGVTPTGGTLLAATEETSVTLDLETGDHVAVSAENEHGESPLSESITIPPPTLDRGSWSVVASSTEAALVAGNVFDGKRDTYWRSSYNPPADPPHTLTIDLGHVEVVAGILYLPRQTASTSGDLEAFALHVSMDGETWQEVATGTRPAGKGWFTIEHAPTSSRFVRLTWLDTAAGSCAEIEILSPPPQRVKLTVQQSANLRDWLDIQTIEVDRQPKQFFRIKIDTP